MPKKFSTYRVRVPWDEAVRIAGSAEALTEAIAYHTKWEWRKKGVPSHAVARFLGRRADADEGRGEGHQQPRTEAEVLLERLLLRGLRLADREATAVLRAVETLLDQAEQVSEEDLRAGGREELRLRLAKLVERLDLEREGKEER